MSRDRTACMMRVRNEARWIRRSLERTFQVARHIVVWDDGSEDATEAECFEALGIHTGISKKQFVEVTESADGLRVLHYIHSPFRPAVRERENVNEIRDKNLLWYYCKAQVPFDHMLCMDGDEILSLDALVRFPEAIGFLENGTADVLTIPFIYLWDSETKRRQDGIYGDQPDFYPILRFPRLFTILRLSTMNLFDTHFSWQGTQGSFHCGSIPREKFVRSDGSILGGFAPLTVMHLGYIDDALRRAKYVFYNLIDPGNKFEGEYRHIIGEPDQHAPGPVELVPWSDQ